MRILVIGAGVVGTTTLEGFRRLGNDVYFYDKDVIRQNNLSARGYVFFEEPKHDFDEMDICFICVEEWNVDKVFKEWAPKFSDDTVEIVVRSTVLPGTCRGLSKEYGIPVFHNPEFLRMATALYDFLCPDKIIIGRPENEDIDILKEAYLPFNTPIIVTDTVTSEFLKLASNAVLSSYISTWNQLGIIASKLGVNSHQVAKILTLDPRISKYGIIHGKRFGGSCLPKDLKSLINTCKDLGVPAVLLEAVEKINEIIE